MAFGSQKHFNAIPPMKGAFPLDHDGECKIFMLKYMKCLNENERENGKCRDESRDYLQCRMEKNLMAKEEWSRLGYRDTKEQVEETGS